MHNKRGIVLVILVLLMFSIFIAKNTMGSMDKQSDSVILENAMKLSGVTIQKGELTFGGPTINKKNISDIKMFSKQIENNFSINMKAPEKPCCPEVKVQFDGEKKLSSYSTLNFKLVGVQDALNGNQLATYLIAKISINKEEQKKVGYYYAYLTDHLKAVGLDPKINTSFIGIIKKNMNHNEQYAFLKAMFQKFKGNITESLDENQVISLSGYTKELKRFDISNHKKLNIQIASRFNPLRNQTTIAIGNPVITMTY